MKKEPERSENRSLEEVEAEHRQKLQRMAEEVLSEEDRDDFADMLPDLDIEDAIAMMATFLALQGVSNDEIDVMFQQRGINVHD